MFALDDNKRFALEAVKSYGDGDVIFTEGEDGRDMYVVKSGEVIVSKASSRGDVVLATLRKGDFFGEMSLLESLPRSATARARGVTEVLCIQPGGFLLKIRRDPTFAFEMLQALSHRVRITSEKLLHEINGGSINADSVQKILDNVGP